MADGPPTSVPSSTPAEPAASGSATTWRQIAPWPYAPWYHSLAVWSGTEALVFGGHSNVRLNHQDPDIASGAGAYDPATNAWRPIAPAPFDLAAATGVAGAGVVYATSLDTRSEASQPQVWAYSVETNAWRELPVPEGYLYGRLTLAGRMLVFTEAGMGPTGRPLHLLDLDTEQWHDAPADPWPVSEAHHAVGLPDGRIVLLETPGGNIPTAPPTKDGATGIIATVEKGAPPSPERPAPCWQGAVLEPGAEHWRVLPPSGIARDGYTQWDLVGTKLATVGTASLPADSVDRECGATAANEVPLYGVLDINTEQWQSIADRPPHQGRYGTLGVMWVNDGPLAINDEMGYDPATQTWVLIPAIPGLRRSYQDPIYIWAGNTLLTFANHIFKDSKSKKNAGPQRVHAGWAWTPPKRSSADLPASGQSRP